MNQRDRQIMLQKTPKDATRVSSPKIRPSAEEFRGQWPEMLIRRNVHHSREEAHRAGEAVSTEPPEHLLGAVGEEDHPEHQSKK